MSGLGYPRSKNEKQQLQFPLLGGKESILGVGASMVHAKQNDVHVLRLDYCAILNAMGGSIRSVPTKPTKSRIIIMIVISLCESVKQDSLASLPSTCVTMCLMMVVPKWGQYIIHNPHWSTNSTKYNSSASMGTRKSSH